MYWRQLDSDSRSVGPGAHAVPAAGSAHDDLSASWSALRGWELGREMSVEHAELIIA